MNLPRFIYRNVGIKKKVQENNVVCLPVFIPPTEIKRVYIETKIACKILPRLKGLITS